MYTHLILLLTLTEMNYVYPSNPSQSVGRVLDKSKGNWGEKGGTTPETNEIVTNICSCHNFFSLSSVQIIFIPACCLLCVL